MSTYTQKIHSQSSEPFLYPHQRKSLQKALTRRESFNLISVHATLDRKLVTVSAFQLKWKRNNGILTNSPRRERRRDLNGKHNYILSAFYLHNTRFCHFVFFFIKKNIFSFHPDHCCSSKVRIQHQRS